VSATVAPGQQVGGLIAETGRTRDARRSGGGRRRVTTWLLSALSVLLFVIFVFPVYWMVNTSFQPNNEIRGSEIHFWPDNFTLRNYETVLFDPGRTPFLPAAANSLVVTVLTVIVALVFAFLASIAVTRFRFKTRRLFIVTILVVQMIPGEAMIVSIFRVIDGWHLLNTILGLTIVYIATVLPFTIWTLRGFVNGVPDSGAGDWRFIDQVEGSPTAFGLAFRSMFPGSGYQLAAAGSRHLRVFQTSTDIQQTQVVWFDTTFTLQAGTHYTLLAAGNLRDKTAKMYILTDDFTDPGSQVALRVINTGAGVVDVYASPTGGTSTLPTPFAAAVANFTATKWVSMAAGAASLRAFATGSTTFPAMIDVAAPAGLAADRANNLTAVGGVTQGGSVLTAFIFPRSVAGSKATSFTSAGILFIVDRNPPSGF